MQFKCIDIFDNGGKREYRFSLPVEHDATARYKLGRSYDFVEFIEGPTPIDPVAATEAFTAWLKSSGDASRQLQEFIASAAELGIVLESQQKPSAGDTPSKTATAVQTDDKAGKSK